jgi:cation transport ATPase
LIPKLKLGLTQKQLEKDVPARKMEHEKKQSFFGEIMPRDGLVISGKTYVNESMLTGESNPVSKEYDDRFMNE